MKIPPQPVPPRPPQNIQIPHHVSDVSVVGSYRSTYLVKDLFEFEVILWEDDEITLRKLIVVESDNIKSAYEHMIKNYPEPYFFKLNTPE